MIFRYSQSEDHHAARIRKTERLFGDKLDFTDIKVLVKIRDIHKIERNNSIRTKLLVMKANKNICFMCQKIFVGQLLVEDNDKKHYVLIKDFNIFMYDYIVGKSIFAVIGYKLYSTEEKLKCHVKDCLKDDGK